MVDLLDLVEIGEGVGRIVLFEVAPTDARPNLGFLVITDGALGRLKRNAR